MKCVSTLLQKSQRKQGLVGPKFENYSRNRDPVQKITYRSARRIIGGIVTPFSESSCSEFSKITSSMTTRFNSGSNKGVTLTFLVLIVVQKLQFFQVGTIHLRRKFGENFAFFFTSLK